MAKDRKAYAREHNTRLNKRCCDCGKQITNQSFRCRSCASKENVRLGKVHPPVSLKGEKSPSWKGGREHSGGYIFISQPNHHRANTKGYVAEHIVVWEETHGKTLPDDWVIHHLNGIRIDNRPKNLAGMPRRSHERILQAKTKRIQELEALLNNQHQLL